MPAIDLDKAKEAREAARREAKQEGPTVKFGGQEYSLAPELPYSVLEALRRLANPETAAVALTDMTEGLLGEHYEAWKATSPSLDDINALLEGALVAYGIENPLESSVS